MKMKFHDNAKKLLLFLMYVVVIFAANKYFILCHLQFRSSNFS